MSDNAAPRRRPRWKGIDKTVHHGRCYGLTHDGIPIYSTDWSACGERHATPLEAKTLDDVTCLECLAEE